ncbi:MAG: insulinase family protein [Chloroflexota bacterium]
MTLVHGFELLREQPIPEINSVAKLYRHARTGAELLSLENDDENKVFSITFATPPPDSTGIAHILEHAVLSGSRKYPTKEPFVELIKGSLATFINAFTFSDKTMYPVASQNLQDFYNLIDVYLDAVFFPLITPETLKQEGWHFEMEAPDAPLNYRGVVFNEMKGVYSSADSMLERYTESALYPDNVYHFDSGGDPEVIPDLSYEQFKNFHATYYHPSNARIFFSGDDDPVERLRIVDAYLSQFEPINVDAQIAPQQPFTAPKRVVRPYDAGDSQDARAMITVSWLLPEPGDMTLMLGMNILAHALLGTQAAPLKKALLDSGLGENTVGHGFEDQMRQMNFSTGMKGVREGDVDKVEQLIIATLTQLAKEGIDRGQIEASLNTVEFQLREFNTGGFPRGLAMGVTVFSTWLYGGDPIAPLAFEAPLNAIKAKLEAGERYFETLIQTYLLDNPHRSTVVLVPDAKLGETRDLRERARLNALREQMNDDDVQRVIDETKLLRELQNTPDSPEALATLPMLSIDDIDREVRRVPMQQHDANGVKVLFHDLPTNGIVYLDVGFDLRTVPQAYLPYLTIFSRALLQMGTSREDFVSLTQRIGRKTGGISTSNLVSEPYGDGDLVAWKFVRGKATVAQVGDLLDILYDVLTDARFDDQARLRQIVLTEKARMESSLVPAGHRFVLQRLESHFSPSGWVGEQTGGIAYLFFLRDLAQRIESDWAGVLANLEAIRAHLFSRGTMLANITVDGDAWDEVQPKLWSFIDSIPARDAQPVQWQPAITPSGEGLSIPAQVNYVGKAANLYELGYQHHGSVHVIVKYLGMTHLWNRIRVQGGAYGAFGMFDHLSGLIRFASYRDPNLLVTLRNYDESVDFLRTLELSQEELTKSIIGTIGDMDGYQLPDAKGYSSLTRYLLGYTDDIRQRVRDEVLGTTQADFHAFADVLAGVTNQGLVVTLGSQAALEAANAEKPGLMQITRVM